MRWQKGTPSLPQDPPPSKSDKKNKNFEKKVKKDLRFKPNFLQGDVLVGDLVPGLVDDAVGALADLLDLLEVVHDHEVEGDDDDGGNATPISLPKESSTLTTTHTLRIRGGRAGPRQSARAPDRSP